MANPIPTPTASDGTGLPDSTWISGVREDLDDYPEYTIETWTADGTNGVVAANATPLKTAKRPVNDGSLTIKDSTSGTTYTIITTGNPTANQVKANYDTGELIFGSAPAAADAIQISYQFCKWRDGKILNNLYAGLRAMFPRVGKVYTDTSIQIQVNVWDYTLPLWCQDPRSRVYSVEVKDPYITTEPWREVRGGFNRVDLTTLQLPFAQHYSPAARLRVVGWGPYLTLADLEPQLYELPKLYALGMLLPKKETFRLRQDTMVPLTQEGGQAPMLMTQSGDHFMKQFEAELDRLSRIPGPGNRQGVRTVYEARSRR